MKQETINLIKSRTKQGFLVIVDPGKENELRVAEAQAKKMLVQAEAEKQANELKQRSLTPLLIQQQFIEKWDGKTPLYGSSPTFFKNVN